MYTCKRAYMFAGIRSNVLTGMHVSFFSMDTVGFTL